MAATAMPVRKVVTLDGEQREITLESVFWDLLEDICDRENTDLAGLCALVSARVPVGATLASALKVFGVDYFRHACPVIRGHAMGTAGAFA